MRVATQGLILLVYLAVSLSTSPRAVRADTFSFAAAMQREAGPVCFGWGDSGEEQVGLFSEGCSGQRAIMPLYWRNFYWSWTTRTVSVRAKRADSSSQVSCTLYAVGSNGVVASQDTKALTAVGSYDWIVLNVTQVLSTSTSFISCNATGGVKIMNVLYNP